MGPSRDTPGAGEMSASEEGRAVVRDVVDDVVNKFLGEPRAAYFARPPDPPHFPVEALAREPHLVSRLFGICMHRCVSKIKSATINGFTEVDGTKFAEGIKASGVHLVLRSVVVGGMKG